MLFGSADACLAKCSFWGLSSDLAHREDLNLCAVRVRPSLRSSGTRPPGPPAKHWGFQGRCSARRSLYLHQAGPERGNQQQRDHPASWGPCPCVRGMPLSFSCVPSGPVAAAWSWDHVAAEHRAETNKNRLLQPGSQDSLFCPEPELRHCAGSLGRHDTRLQSRYMEAAGTRGCGGAPHPHSWAPSSVCLGPSASVSTLCCDHGTCTVCIVQLGPPRQGPRPRGSTIGHARPPVPEPGRPAPRGSAGWVPRGLSLVCGQRLPAGTSRGISSVRMCPWCHFLL